MVPIAQNILASTQNAFAPDNTNATPTMNDLSLDSLNSVDEGDAVFSDQIASFMGSMQSDASGVMSGMKNFSVSASPAEMLKVQKNMTSYSVATQMLSKGLGEVSKGLNQLTSIQ